MVNRAHQLPLFEAPESAGALDPAAVQGGQDSPRQDTPPPPARALPPASVPDVTRGQAETGRDAVSFVRHPRARRYLIRVRLDGSVRVTLPRRGSRREAEAFYQKQLGWVTSQVQRVAQVRQRLPDDLPDTDQRRLRAQAKRELPPRLFELAAQVGVAVRKVSVRNQRQRWSSCSQSGLICLNWRLITMPAWVRDYVLYHELMHVKQMDHSPAFWELVAGVCPAYQQARRWLRRHAHAPHAPEAHADAALGAGQGEADTSDDEGC